jgi:hypothetical protein
VLRRDIEDPEYRVAELAIKAGRLERERVEPGAMTSSAQRARLTGDNHALAAYVIIAALVTLAILWRTRETALAPLR